MKFKFLNIRLWQTFISIELHLPPSNMNNQLLASLKGVNKLSNNHNMVAMIRIGLATTLQTVYLFLEKLT